MEEIAEVYARSLFEVAKDRDKLDTIREQLGQLADAVAESRELQTFLFSPHLSSEDKKEGLGRAIEGGDETLMNFLELLVENHRAPLLMRIRRRFDRMWEQENRILPVQLTSAIELDEETVRRVGDQIGESTGRRVELSSHVDPDILGGIVLRVGNQILDASIRNRLDRLRRTVARA